MSRLSLVTLSATELIPLQDVKSYLRQDIDDDDTIIALLLDAACSYAETFTNRQFLSKTYDLFLDTFDGVLDKHSSFVSFDAYFSIPSDRVSIILPLYPLVAITEWEYQDKDDATQTFDQSTVVIDTNTNTFAKITLKSSESWPDLSGEANAIRIRFTAGTGKPTDVPATIRLAVLQLVAHWFENRESVVIGTITSEVPVSAKALLWSAKMPSV